MTIARRIALCAAAVLLVAFSTSFALAHEHRAVDGLETTVGWFEEPAFAGFRNAAQFAVEGPGTEAAEPADEHASGTPVEDAELKLEVIFGEADAPEKSEPLDLEPAFGTPGEYRAFLIPTRPGTYTFRIFGTVAGEEFDETYTSGEDTFNDVQQTSEREFPAADPSRGELAEALGGLEGKIDTLNESNSRTRLLAFGAVALAVLAALLALFRGRGTG